MKAGKILTIAIGTMVSTSILAIPSSAQAGSRDFIGGVAVGVGGTLLYQHLKKKKKGKAVRKSKKRKGSYSNGTSARITIATVPTTRGDVVDIQARLNQLGFNAGTPDGIPGRRTRAAVRDFQYSIGSNVTGKLTISDLGALYQNTGNQAASLQNGPLAGQQSYQPGQQTVFPATSQAGIYQQNAPAHAPAAGNNSPVVVQPNQFAAGQPVPQATLPSSGVPVTSYAAQGNQLEITGQTTAPSQQALSPDTPQIVSLQQPVVEEEVDDQLPSPSIFGVSPGSTISEAKLALSYEGFEKCSEDGKFFTCEKKTGSLNDRVIIAPSGSSDEAIVYMLARELSFDKPVRETFIKGRLAKAYPRLIGEADMKIASTECKAYLAGQQGSFFRTSIEETELTNDIIDICPDYYSINLGKSTDNAGVEKATIILFDSSSLNTGTALNEQEQELEDNLKF